MFGPPLELFHCGGTAVVFISGHDEYIVNGKNAVVVSTGDTDGVRCPEKLICDRTELSRLQEGARQTADIGLLA